MQASDAEGSLAGSFCEFELENRGREVGAYGRGVARWSQ